MSGTWDKKMAGEPDPGCPRCRGKPLERCVHEGHVVDLCPRCAGLWCVPQHWIPGAPKSRVVSPAGADSELRPSDVRRDLLCPRCGVALTAFLVRGVRGLEIDRCPQCEGVWFDHREWDYVEALRRWKQHRHAAGRETTWKEWFFQALLSLPVEFNVRPRRKPWMTWTIIAICVMFYLVINLGFPERLAVFAFHMSSLPSLQGFAGLVTSQFAHAGLIHLVGNMYFLCVLGDNVEDVLGRPGFLAFFLLCGTAGDLGWGLISPRAQLPAVGASAAISGIIAAYFLLFRDAHLQWMIFNDAIRLLRLVFLAPQAEDGILRSGVQAQPCDSHVA